MDTLIRGTVIPEDDIKPELLKHLVEKLGRISPPLAIANSFNTIALLLLFWQDANKVLALAWALPLLGFCFMQWMTGKAIQKRSDVYPRSSKFVKKAEYRGMFLGIWWCLSCFVFNDGTDLTGLALCGAGLGMCAAGCAASGPMCGMASRFSLGGFAVILTSEVWASSNVTLLVGFLGASLVVILIYMSHLKYLDTVEMLRSSNEVEKSHRRLMNAIEAMPSPVVILDEDEKPVLSNEAYKKLIEPFEQHKSEDDQYVVGEQVYIRSERDMDDHQSVQTFTHITRLKAKQDELAEAYELAEAANTAKSRFLSMIGAELLAPARTIQGMGRLLGTGSQLALNPSLVQQYADKVASNGEMLIEAIETLVHYSSLENGSVELEPEPVNLENLVSNAVIALSKTHLDLSRGQVSITIDPKTRCIFTNYTALYRIVFNLVSNAVKYSPKGAKITIRAGIERSGRPFLFVRDRGAGMSPAKIEEAFVPFHNGNNDVEVGLEKGFGLGLSVSRSFATLIEADIVLDSEEGQGTTAFVLLPVSSVMEPDQIHLLAPQNNTALSA